MSTRAVQDHVQEALDTLGSVSALAIAKKDFQDAIRSPYFWAVTVAITLAIGFFLFQVVDQAVNIISQAEEEAGQDFQLTTDLFVVTLRFGFQVFVPLLAIVATYTSIAGERATGSLKLLLSLPNSRRDVVVGKLLGRFGVVATPLVVAFVLSALFFPLSQFTFVPETYAQFALLTLLLGIIFVSFTMGVSAAATTTRRAAIAAFGVYAYFLLFWSRLARNVPELIARVIDLERGVKLQLEVAIQVLNPMSAYRTLVFSRRLDAPMEARSMLILRGSGSGAGGPATFNQQIGARRFLRREVFVTEVPWYFTDVAVLVVMLLWLVIPLAIGYVLFKRADL